MEPVWWRIRHVESLLPVDGDAGFVQAPSYVQFTGLRYTLMFRQFAPWIERFLPILTLFGMIPPNRIPNPIVSFHQSVQHPMEVYSPYPESLPHPSCLLSMSIQISLSGLEDSPSIAINPIKQVVRKIARDYGWQKGEVSIAIVDDAAIRLLNRRHLQHDYATDVISFDLTDGDSFLEGEVIVSLTTATREAPLHGWSPADELLLYVIHGTLHIIGLDDKSATSRKAMREAERYYLQFMKVAGWESYSNHIK